MGNTSTKSESACYVSDYTPKPEHPSEKDPHKPTNHQMFRGFNGLGTMPVCYMAYPPNSSVLADALPRESKMIWSAALTAWMWWVPCTDWGPILPLSIEYLKILWLLYQHILFGLVKSHIFLDCLVSLLREMQKKSFSCVFFGSQKTSDVVNHQNLV